MRVIAGASLGAPSPTAPRLVAVASERELYREYDRSGGKAPCAIFPISGRELEVAHLVADGLTNQGIADKLVLSTRTIQAHVSSLLRKTSTTNRTHLAVTLIRRGVVSVPWDASGGWRADHHRS
ncbi:MAG TPA: LuxR C-terminal-related transcriptional regulator [Solirubrobacteraceae bacterium]|jgi:DNA-binding NarL/FixJ family response regulator|nr:LuxR C-terminal-related transcriptional regulator [Solirubrobacteraceae bacterium]